MIRLLFVAMATLLIFSRCSTLQTYSQVDEKIDFSTYKTYSFFGWDKGSDLILKEADKKLIESTFASELKTRKLQQAGLSGELIFTLYVTTKNEVKYAAETTRMTGYGGYYGYGPGWGWDPSLGFTFTQYEQKSYKRGTLICSVYDRQQKKLIWEGVAHETIKPDSKDRDLRITSTIKNLMATFPIKAVK